MDRHTDLAAVLQRVFSPPDAPRIPVVSAVDTQATTPSPRPAADPQSMAEVLDAANTELALRQTGLRFVQHAALPRPLIQIIDQASGEVLRQIPNETAVRIAQALTGLLIDDRG